MCIESIDDFVWEHYESWTGYEPFQDWINGLSWYNITWIIRVNRYAEMKRDEHWRKWNQLKQFQISLDPQLRDCVDPFMDQQFKLYLAYTSIWSMIARP